MYSMDAQKYPSLNIGIKGKVQCPDFTLFLSGIYEHVQMLSLSDYLKYVIFNHGTFASNGIWK